jgi:dTMP kinase
MTSPLTLVRKKAQCIVFEGIDGAGKSSYLPDAMAVLQAHGCEPVLSREPGGTALGEALREMLLHQTMAAETECLLIFAARQQHLKQVIEPALAAGRWVLCDRFTDATYAYQGAGRGFDLNRIALLEQWVQGAWRPDHVLLFDLDPSLAAQRRSQVREADKFERLDHAFFERVRAAYLARAEKMPNQYHSIDTKQSQDEVRVIVNKIITSICI